MTVQHFRELEEIDQLKILIQFGILIGEITEKNMKIFLYQVHDFFVETKYIPDTDDLIGIDAVSKIERENYIPWTVFYLTKNRKEQYPK
jgi:hypothetical protein